MEAEIKPKSGRGGRRPGAGRPRKTAKELWLSGSSHPERIRQRFLVDVWKPLKGTPQAHVTGAVRQDPIAAALEYEEQVLSRAIPACRFVRLAIERHRRDLEQPDQFYFDEDAGRKVVEFVEMLPNCTGKKWAGTPIRLQPWQDWIVTRAFGWRRQDGAGRRFRRAYIEMGKGNGKSALAAALCLYCAFADGEPNSEVYATATSRDQARRVFDAATRMLRRAPAIKDALGVELFRHAIAQNETESRFAVLSSDKDTVEGITPFFICCDELHAHGSREFFDNLDTANGKRDGSMLWAITTGGGDRAGIAYQQREQLIEILEGRADDPVTFGVIYGMDAGDDPFAEPAWQKANPGYGYLVSAEDMRAKAERAKRFSSQRHAFLAKHLNEWAGVGTGWIAPDKWDGCRHSFTPEDCRGDSVVVGVDLSRVSDLCCVMHVVAGRLKGSGDTKMHYFTWGRYWLPSQTIEDETNVAYRGWVADGWLTACPGPVNDLQAVEDWLLSLPNTYGVDVKRIAFDPWEAKGIMQKLEEHFGSDVAVTVPQTTKNLSEAMKEVEAAVLDGRLHHNGDPILGWAVSNVMVEADSRGNVFPRKRTRDAKIDPLSALLNAISVIIASKET
jgi:phage terminase large subunit-like protein